MKKIPVRRIKASMKEPGFPERFNIRDLDMLLKGNGMVQELHRHDFYFILVLKKGSGIHEIDFNPYKISDRTVFFMRPGQVHHLTLKAGSTGYLIGFSAGFYDAQDRCSHQLLQRIGQANHFVLDTAAFKRTASVLLSVYEEQQAKQQGYEDVIKANLCIFFTELVRQRHDRNPQSSVNTYARERLDEFLALLEAQVCEHKQASYYTDKLKLSPYQLNSITRTLLGKTSSELINEQIILEAKRRLLATSEQVKEIAWQLGYEDVSYFIRFFRKHTGHSPEVFRQHFR